MKFVPVVGDDELNIIQMYSDIATDIGQTQVSEIIKAYMPRCDRFEYLRTIKALNFIERFMAERQKKLSRKEATQQNDKSLTNGR